MEIDITIDSLTNCLVENATGIEYDTDYCLVSRTITKSDAMAFIEEGWKFDWSIPHRNGYEIYQLYVEGEDDVQGMIALKHIRDQLFTHVDIVEAAPFNVGHDGRYSGVGAHLFAIACKLSWDVGNEGYVQFTAKTVNDAVTAACQQFMVTSDKLEYEVLEEGSTGFLGFNAKPAKIMARVKGNAADTAKEFLDEMFAAMKMVVAVEVKYDEDEKLMDIDLSGDDMGVLIGKRGQTLDSVQYLVSLVVNKESEDYIRVKVDTENYRKRRKETLENLAKNIAYKVKRTKRSVSLEPMNPYERRIIHSALQNDKFVTTHSEGEEPYRHVVVTLKRN